MSSMNLTYEESGILKKARGIQNCINLNQMKSINTTKILIILYDHLGKTFELEDIWLEKVEEDENIVWQTSSRCADQNHSSDRVYQKIEWHGFTYHHLKCIYQSKPGA